MKSARSSAARYRYGVLLLPALALASCGGGVFEAGYFISSKGKGRVLIVRETGAKMPADLGGDIYASFDDRADLTGVEKTIQRFLLGL